MVIPIASAQDLPVILGTDGNDTLRGTDKGESIYGQAGDDTIDAGAGNDDLDGGPGADSLHGGAGTDSVSYSTSTPVTVAIDGRGGDGAAGEGDDVDTDVEDLFGADGDDKLAGSRSRNTIDGGGGDDRIDGGAGEDALLGGPGEDTISARDSTRDRIDCGPGLDTVIVDTLDVVTECERQERSAVTPEFLLDQLLPAGSRLIRGIRLTGVANRSNVVVGCRSACRPRRAPARPLLTRRSVSARNGIAVLKLPRSPRLVGGTTFEIGVRAPGATSRCRVFKLNASLSKLRALTKTCTTAARKA